MRKVDGACETWVGALVCLLRHRQSMRTWLISTHMNYAPQKGCSHAASEGHRLRH